MHYNNEHNARIDFDNESDIRKIKILKNTVEVEEAQVLYVREGKIINQIKTT